jgi:hypothetical protein
MLKVSPSFFSLDSYSKVGLCFQLQVPIHPFECFLLPSHDEWCEESEKTHVINSKNGV